MMHLGCGWEGNIKELILVKAGFWNSITDSPHLGFLLACPKCGGKFYHPEEIERRLNLKR